VKSRQGACTAQIGTWWWSLSFFTASTCWLSESIPTITSTAS
jgi:hypothetical protein